MGGREALMVTQWLPNYFDGSDSGDSGLKLATMSTHEVYDAQVARGARDADGPRRSRHAACGERACTRTAIVARAQAPGRRLPHQVRRGSR